jgi:hypothetical protein
MKWKYWLYGKNWNEERRPWAEVFVRPQDPDYRGEPLWVTILCVGSLGGNEGGPLSEWHSRLVDWLGGRPYRINMSGEIGLSDLYVRGSDFTRDEFLGWVMVWLRDGGLPVTELVEAPLAEVLGTDHCEDPLKALIDRYSDISGSRA